MSSSSIDRGIFKNKYYYPLVGQAPLRLTLAPLLTGLAGGVTGVECTGVAASISMLGSVRILGKRGTQFSAGLSCGAARTLRNRGTVVTAGLS